MYICTCIHVHVYTCTCNAHVDCNNILWIYPFRESTAIVVILGSRATVSTSPSTSSILADFNWRASATYGIENMPTPTMYMYSVQNMPCSAQHTTEHMYICILIVSYTMHMYMYICIYMYMYMCIVYCKNWYHTPKDEWIFKPVEHEWMARATHHLLGYWAPFYGSVCIACLARSSRHTCNIHAPQTTVE